MLEFLTLIYEKPIKILVLVTFFFALFKLSFKYKFHKLLILILIICSVTEIINSVFIYNGISTILSTTIGTILHNIIWLIVLNENVYFKKLFKFIFFSFLIFTVVNFIFIEGINHFNNYTFVLGAFIYITIFIYESFHKLKNEQFSFFMSNEYLLLFAPVIFFLGVSIIFGFKSDILAETIMFNKITLFDFIIYFVNIIYYTLINIYIYRERKFKHA